MKKTFLRNVLNFLAISVLLFACKKEISNNGSISAQSDEAAELVLFAAAYLNLSGEFANPAWHYGGREQLSLRLLERTLIWLGDNLPKLVYSPPVEKLIEDSPKVPT